MRCEKCNTVTPDGQSFTFHYGKSMGTSQTLQGTWRFEYTHFRIGGSAEVYICDLCMGRLFRGFSALILIILAWLSSTIIFLAILIPLLQLNVIDVDIGSGIILGGPVLVAVLVDYYLSRQDEYKKNLVRRMRASNSRRLSETGAEQAILLRRAGLEGEGYNAFFTPAQYNNLSRK